MLLARGFYAVTAGDWEKLVFELSRAAALLGSLAMCPGHSFAQSTANITGYHNDPARSGSFIVPEFTYSAIMTLHFDTTFKAPIATEHSYTQPLYWVPPGASHGYIIVSTMSNNVHAFSGANGRQVWVKNVGTPVPSSALPCGGQNPWGIAGTPVIDPLAGKIYFDAEILVNGVPKHQIFGLSLVDGSLLPGWPIDVETAVANLGSTFSTPIQDQRGGLALVNGKLYVAYGGHGGDCGNYHGWVLGIAVGTHHMFGAWSTTAVKGGIWGPGGVTYDGNSLFVTTGNSSKPLKVWGDNEAIIRIPFNLSHSSATTDFFTPGNWQGLDLNDLDLSATQPVPIDVPNGSGTSSWIIAFGKDGNAYLADRANLGGFGNNLATLAVESGEIKTGPAIYSDTTGTYVAISGPGVNCPPPTQANIGLTMVKVTASPAPAMRVAWCASLATSGSPIITTTDGKANPIVWIAGVEGDGNLHAFNATTGAVLFNGDHMTGLLRFQTFIAAEGRIFVATTNRLYAFTP